MHKSKSSFQNVKKKYLQFLRSQEVLSEPFRDKLGQLKKFYIPIGNSIYKSFENEKTTKVIGLTGGQGSGKSTISNILKIILNEGYNLNTVNFSIDDFYKTYKDRKKMSLEVSPLFKTRGVPGTHDTKLLFNCLKNLKKKKFRKFSVPKFDKSIDDRLPKKQWQIFKKKPDIVIFEGWCVGVTPQKNKDLKIPINTLEKKNDTNRVWRYRVNDELKKKYKKIFNLIDFTIFLKVPSFKHVFKWRLLQEKKLQVNSAGKKVMNKDQIKKFVMFYERLTKHMFNSMEKVNAVIKIDTKHRLKTIKFK